MAPNLLIACVTIVVLAAIFAALVAFLARVCEWRVMCPARQSRKPAAPRDAEPADVPDMSIVPGMDGQDHIRAVGE